MVGRREHRGSGGRSEQDGRHWTPLAFAGAAENQSAPSSTGTGVPIRRSMAESEAEAKALDELIDAKATAYFAQRNALPPAQAEAANRRCRVFRNRVAALYA